MPAAATAAHDVTVSANAYRRVARIVADEHNASALRISVEGGGCSGFSYKFDIVSIVPNADDVVFSDGTATVLIDALSLVYMKNSVVDFVDDLMGQSFKITNPNAVASCGCGTSFSV
ncbi:MAG: iron-sulfur cluster assembly accessory protein [Phyllobacteriaceae bacterium]|nr:iron-sulfur cluster assembly accessory protein [Phyllobacteriaceae bacterium]